MFENLTKRLRNWIGWTDAATVSVAEPIVSSLPNAVEPASVETLPQTEPVAAVENGEPSRRPWNKIYNSDADRQRAWRDRQKKKAAVASAIPQPVAESPAVVEDPPIVGAVEVVVVPAAAASSIPISSESFWNSLSGLRSAGAKAATLSEIPVAEPVSRIEAQQSVIAVESASVATVADVLAGALAAEPVAPIESQLERDHREAAVAAAVQGELDSVPVNWDDETRTDLPQRTRGRIGYLLPFEADESDRRGLPLDRFTGAPALTVRRIQNDIVRRAYGGGGGHLRANPEAFQVRGGSDGNRHSSW